MAYIGRDIQYGTINKQTFTANGSTTVFTLDQGVADANNLIVSIILIKFDKSKSFKNRIKMRSKIYLKILIIFIC